MNKQTRTKERENIKNATRINISEKERERKRDREIGVNKIIMYRIKKNPLKVPCKNFIPSNERKRSISTFRRDVILV